jgi:hypothetical protein
MVRVTAKKGQCKMVLKVGFPACLSVSRTSLMFAAAIVLPNLQDSSCMPWHSLTQSMQKNILELL